MHPWFDIAGVLIPGYGLMIALGVIAALGLGYVILRRSGDDADGFLALTGYAMLGALLGSKLLYLATVSDRIEWARVLDPAYPLGLLASGGFVFYGGLAGGLIFAVLGARLHGLELAGMLERVIFVLPLAQGFGRVGCLLAGCCYGMEYAGPFAISFPPDSFPGTAARFPVQALCAVLLWMLAAVLYGISRTSFKRYGPWCYLTGYALLRFLMEFLRGDLHRGVYAGIALSQWISLGLLTVAAGWLLIRRQRS